MGAMSKVHSLRGGVQLAYHSRGYAVVWGGACGALNFAEYTCILRLLFS